MLYDNKDDKNDNMERKQIYLPEHPSDLIRKYVNLKWSLVIVIDVVLDLKQDLGYWEWLIQFSYLTFLKTKF